MATPARQEDRFAQRASISPRLRFGSTIALLALGAICVLSGYYFFKYQKPNSVFREDQIIAALDALDGGDFALAQPALLSWAERGDAAAQFALARMYANGRGVTQDARQAERWYRRAVQQGDTRAMVELGRLYKEGHVIRQNLSEAVELFRKATSHGEPLGPLNLGLLYLEGEGVPKNLVLALEFFENAARRGSAEAMHMLGYMHRRGLGVPPDLDLAFDRYRRAAARGFERSVKALESFGVVASEDSGWVQPAIYAPGEIPLRYDGHSYYVDVLVADRERVSFKLDTGASDVTVPGTILRRLQASEIITEADFKGEAGFRGWDGRVGYRETLTLPSLRIGGHLIANIDASEGGPSDSTLLGLNVLNRFRSWSIDNERRVLILNGPR